MSETELTFKLLINTVQDIYEMRTSAKEAHAEHKQSSKMGITITNNERKHSNVEVWGMFERTVQEKETRILQVSIQMDTSKLL